MVGCLKTGVAAKGLLWGTILVFQREELLQVAADFAPQWGGPARSIVSYRFRDEGADCILELQDNVFGLVSERTRNSLSEGWKTLLVDCFKPYVENGRRPELPDSVESPT